MNSTEITTMSSKETNNKYVMISEKEMHDANSMLLCPLNLTNE